MGPPSFSRNNCLVTWARASCGSCVERRIIYGKFLEHIGSSPDPLLTFYWLWAQGRQGSENLASVQEAEIMCLVMHMHNGAKDEVIWKHNMDRAL